MIRDKFGIPALIGADVEMPEPNETDLHNQSFVGIVIGFRGKNIVVCNRNGNHFEIEPERVIVVDVSPDGKTYKNRYITNLNK